LVFFHGLAPTFARQAEGTKEDMKG